MFKNIQLGDNVWDVRYGWGKVVELTRKDNTYSFSVEFLIPSNSKQNCSYSIDGKAAEWHNFPVLFWNEFKVPAEAFIKPLPKFEKDTRVLVWNNGCSMKIQRYFSHFTEEGVIHCYDKGCTSWTTNYTQEWDNWELYID